MQKTNASPREDFILPGTCRILPSTCSSPQVEVLILMADSNHSPTHTPPVATPPPTITVGIYITICNMMAMAVITICHENQHLHLRGGASAREDSASAREDKILPSTCISFLQRWGSSIDETPPLIITNHPPYHLQLHWWPSFSLAHRFASFLDHTPPLNLHHCK